MPAITGSDTQIMKGLKLDTLSQKSRQNSCFFYRRFPPHFSRHFGQCRRYCLRCINEIVRLDDCRSDLFNDNCESNWP